MKVSKPHIKNILKRTLKYREDFEKNNIVNVGDILQERGEEMYYLCWGGSKSYEKKPLIFLTFEYFLIKASKECTGSFRKRHNITCLTMFGERWM